MEIALIVVALVALAGVLVLFRVIHQRDEATRELSTLKAAGDARLDEMEKARQDLDTYFKGMAAEALQANSQALLRRG